MQIVKPKPKTELTAVQKAQADFDKCVEERRANGQQILALRAKAETLMAAKYHAETALAIARQDATRAEHDAIAEARMVDERTKETLARQREHKIWQAPL